MKAALAGYAPIALGIFLLGYLVPDEEVRRPMWLFVFLALAVSAKFCWSQPSAPKSPSGWLSYVGLAALSGLILAAVDGVLYGVQNSNWSLADIATSNPRILFDFSLSLLAGMVAVSGWTRSLVLKEQRDV